MPTPPDPPLEPADMRARTELARLAAAAGLDVGGGAIVRTSSRFCLSVEHGDYNGTDLFGVGTDRFLWIQSKPNGSGRVRLFSGAFAGDGVVTFVPGRVPPARSSRLSGTWARFPLGADWALRAAGLPTGAGLDAVVHSEIPGGGMSRSASLAINLLCTFLGANGRRLDDRLQLAELAQRVENDYAGSPCGLLDQVMICCARRGMGTLYEPRARAVRHVPLGAGAPDFRLLSLDTGTVRPGLEQSTYAVRRRECAQLLELLQPEFGLVALADVRTPELHARIQQWLGPGWRHLGDRLRYLFAAQQNFARLVSAWRDGDVASVGAVFRADGHGLRDLYAVSGPELETMCDLVRTVPGVHGERMLGGGDKGAAGALVAAEAVEPVRAAVALGYPRSHPEFAGRFAVHDCRLVDGIAAWPRA